MAKPVAAGGPSPVPDPALGVPAPIASPRRRIRRRWFVVVLGALALVAILAFELPQFLSPSSKATTWQNITAGIGDGRVPKQTALEAFAYVYGVDIPGVTVPKGVEGGDEPTDGTGVMTWVQSSWSQLTPDQQAVINRFLVPGPDDHVIPIDPGASAAASGVMAAPAFQLDAARNIGPVAVGGAPGAPAALEAAMTKELIADIKHIGPKLGIPVITGGSVAYPNIELNFSNTTTGGTLFQTIGVESALHYEPCHMTAFKNAWQGQTVTGTGGVSPELHVLMTHEVIHCYQNVIWGNETTHLAIPVWIREGTALYLAADDTHIAEPMIPAMWTNGWFVPETALTNRSYDAFGYFALLDHAGRDLWSLMRPAWQAAAATSSARSDAFIAVVGGDKPDVRNNWAESYLRQVPWGDPWIAYGFGLPDTTQVYQHSAQAQPAPGWVGSLSSRSNTVLSVDTTAGEVVTVSTDGLASVHDQTGHSDLAFTKQRFCVAASCVCPKGTKLAGQDMASNVLNIPFVAAFNAPEGGSKYSIVSDTLADLCGLKPSAPPSAGNPGDTCAASCAESNGDPHIYTIDQNPYDFQAAGEFTLLRSADGSFDVQARQEPDGTAGTVSLTTATAAKVGSHRVDVYLGDFGLTARVDGKPADLSGGPVDLGGGARLSNSSDGFEVDFPDGTRMWELSTGGYGITVDIQPSPSLTKDGTGLLGPVATGGLGVPALPDGTRLPATNDRHQAYVTLYSQFADAWRVTDSTTLFDYDPGKSTASYTIKPYPIEAKAATLADLTPAQRAAGEAACAAITDARLHDDCVYDVGVTGDSGFAGSYAIVQAFRNTPIVLSTLAPGSVSPGTQPPQAVSAAVTVTHGTAVGGYAVGPDDTVYLSVQTAPNTYSLISFDPKAGKIVHQVTVPAATEVHYAAGSVWLPGLKTDASVKNCSITRFDAASLTEQTTIAIPCADVLGPLVASDGSAIWFEDTTNYHPATEKGAVATRIDPATNQPGTSVPMPSAGGYLIDSQGAIFYADENNGYYVLTTGPTPSTSFEFLGKFPNVAIPAGTGLWTQSAGGKPAMYFTQAGSPDRTVQVRGVLVGGDASAVYVEAQVPTSGGGTQPALLRYPADGSPQTRIALPPKVGGNQQPYNVDPPPIVTGDGFVKVWAVQKDTPQASILLQWTPLP